MPLLPPVKLSGVSKAAEVSCFSFVDINIYGLGSSVWIFGFISCLFLSCEFPWDHRRSQNNQGYKTPILMRLVVRTQLALRHLTYIHFFLLCFSKKSSLLPGASCTSPILCKLLFSKPSFSFQGEPALTESSRSSDHKI